MAEAKSCSIYALIDPNTFHVRYVGKACDVNARLKAHLRDPSDTRKARWIRSIMRTGAMPIVLILERDPDDWKEAERRWIAHFAAEFDLTNATAGGEGLSDPSVETRAKIGAAQRALHADPDYRARAEARYVSAEWRASISAATRGISKTAEHVAALPQNRADYPWSAEIREERRRLLLTHAAPVGRRAPRTERQLAHVAEMIKANRGRPGWAKGRVLTPAEREARAVKQRGVPKPPEHREKIRQAALRRWARARGEEV